MERVHYFPQIMTYLLSIEQAGVRYLIEVVE